jgi:hypothetical protein
MVQIPAGVTAGTPGVTSDTREQVGLVTVPAMVEPAGEISAASNLTSDSVSMTTASTAAAGDSRAAARHGRRGEKELELARERAGSKLQRE